MATTCNLKGSNRPVLPLVSQFEYTVRYGIKSGLLPPFKSLSIQGEPEKRGHRLMTIILSILNRFTNFFHWQIPW